MKHAVQHVRSEDPVQDLTKLELRFILPSKAVLDHQGMMHSSHSQPLELLVVRASESMWCLV